MRDTLHLILSAPEALVTAPAPADRPTPLPCPAPIAGAPLAPFAAVALALLLSAHPAPGQAQAQVPVPTAAWLPERGPVLEPVDEPPDAFSADPYRRPSTPSVPTSLPPTEPALISSFSALGVLALASTSGTPDAPSIAPSVPAAPPPAPGLRCAGARSEVEQLVCRDADLAALDRRLNQVYQSAMAKAQGRMAAQLRGEQRGWIKGRNECWKATVETWITASWTVRSVRDCVVAQYRLRTAELQALWQLLPSRSVTYACQNQATNELVAQHYASDPATVRLSRGDRSALLWRLPDAYAKPDTELYEGANVSLRRQGTAVRLQWLNPATGQTEDLRCEPR